MAENEKSPSASGGLWKKWFARDPASSDDEADNAGNRKPATWNMGMLNDKDTIAVPGSVLLLATGRNEPLGLRNQPARTSHSSLPTGFAEPPPTPPPAPVEDEKKKTSDGQIILDPQPDDSRNDPLNWPAWRRDSALLSLGLYCMVGGGITPIIAAGFTDVAEEYDVPVEEVALTTGLFMMGLGIGCVIWSPTAILFGKRPIYLFSAILFVISAVWCALSPTFTSLILARIFQGIAVSPVECLPSATIAEIFFLHERAYRIGVYTLLLLGGKNLVPLVSAAIMQSLSWRWVFWIVAIVVGFSGGLLFFFVPETFWDRTPVHRPEPRPKRPTLMSRLSSARHIPQFHRRSEANDHQGPSEATADLLEKEKSGEQSHDEAPSTQPDPQPSTEPTKHKKAHVGFAPEPETHEPEPATAESSSPKATTMEDSNKIAPAPPISRGLSFTDAPSHSAVGDPESQTLQVPQSAHLAPGVTSDTESEKFSISNLPSATKSQVYTHQLRKAPPQTFGQYLRLHNGRINQDKWWKVMLRPFILFSYPAVLWSAVIYSMSVGWLIVISESVSVIYREEYYHFNALQTGLMYISPFIGGVLGTAVAGRFSDVVVKYMSKRNGGLYEPEFRLVMAIPIAITTVMGLMGFGWSAEEQDPWIVPTVFFGIVSFGCSLGSTTSITFCVDSYRQYAGEALVTLNFSKNIFHGLVFSLFFTEWLTHEGSKSVFIWVGVIQLIACFFSIPMYIYGKRARMWTVRKNFMENF